MKKKNTAPQSSIGKWLNDEARHKDEPQSTQKHDAKKSSTPTAKKPSKKK